jgi:hypothetical protein
MLEKSLAQLGRKSALRAERPRPAGKLKAQVIFPEEERPSPRKPKVLLPKTNTHEELLTLVLSHGGRTASTTTYYGESEVSLCKRLLRQLSLPASQKNLALMAGEVGALVARYEKEVRDSLDRLYFQKVNSH